MWNLKDWACLVMIISNLTFIAWQMVTLGAIVKKLIKDAKDGEEK